MGTPEFAVASLDILHQAGYNIVGVITAPDKYGGRGRKTLIESDVKKYAQKNNLKILQPTNLKSQKFQEKLKALKADLQVVVAFRMLPVSVWDMPPLGTYNLHGSLLPNYRGAAPINWAIINGETKTGVTSFKLKHAIDTGSILYQKEIPIYPDDNAGSLHDRMKWVGADVIYETVKSISEGNVNLKEQDESSVSHAPKLNTENTQIDFSLPGKKIYDLIRGLSPYPVAWMNLDGKKTKIYRADYEPGAVDTKPGSYTLDNGLLKIACADGQIVIQELQMSGKRRMSTKEFLNGYELKGM